MSTCPCGMLMEAADYSWPPYRTFIKDSKGEITFAICIHGAVVIDKTVKHLFDCFECNFPEGRGG